MTQMGLGGIGEDAASGSAAKERQLRLKITVQGASFSAAGDGELVLRALEQFEEKVLRSTPPPAPPPSASEAPPSRNEAEQQPKDQKQAPQVEEEPLAVFMDRHKMLKTNPQIATGIILWAKENRQQEEMDVDAIKQYWRGTKHKLPANLPRDVRKAAKEGWIMQESEGRYSTRILHRGCDPDDFGECDPRISGDGRARADGERRT